MAQKNKVLSKEQPAKKSAGLSRRDQSSSTVSPANQPQREKSLFQILRQAGNYTTAQTLNPVAQDTTEESTAISAPKEPLMLDGMSTFAPSEAMEAYLKQTPVANIPVRLADLAQGTLSIHKDGEGYSTIEGTQAIPLIHPGLKPLHDIDIAPMLAIKIEKNNITGYATIALGDSFGKPDALIRAIKENSDAMGWIGLDIGSLPQPKNVLENGILYVQVPKFDFTLGGYLNGTGSFGLANNRVTFEANAKVSVKGLTEADMNLSRDDEGKISGEINIPVSLNKFSGEVNASFKEGVVDVQGVVQYTDEKFSGEVTLLVTDAATARTVALQKLGPEAVEADAEQTKAAGKSKKAPKGERALAGWGTLNFAFNKWLAGQAQVIIDNEGHLTVIGEIKPQAEVELFPQRDWVYPVFKVEARALYGVPLVGNVFVFANIGLDALAKLGPGKLYNISAKGRYSTDPQIFKEFKIEGTLNISAFAGIRLRAEGGAGVELLDHDIKVGVGINGLAGIQGYVEATPTIGYSEQSNPDGKFFIKGHMEIAAQPFLGLSGDMFVELDSPWWSPAPDKKWVWPLASLEYPLPGEFGIGADVDYVIGSGEVPKIQMGEVNFSKDKFMTDLFSDHVPPKRQGKSEKEGKWQEGKTKNKKAEPKKVSKGGAPVSDKPATGKQSSGDKKQTSSPAVMKRWHKGMKALGKVAKRSEKEPLTKDEVDTTLLRLEKNYGFAELKSTRAGEGWQVHTAMNPNKKAFIKGKFVSETKNNRKDKDKFGVSRTEIERRFRHRLDQSYVFAMVNDKWTVRRGRGNASGPNASQRFHLASMGGGSYSLKLLESSEEVSARHAHDKIAQHMGPDKMKYLKGRGKSIKGHAEGGFSPQVRKKINEIGNRSGDHSNPNIKISGTKSGNWIPDHQPPGALGRGGANIQYRFYPHSLKSSQKQGGFVTSYKNQMKKERNRDDSNWAKGVKHRWFWEN